MSSFATGNVIRSCVVESYWGIKDRGTIAHSVRSAVANTAFAKKTHQWKRSVKQQCAPAS